MTTMDDYIKNYPIPAFNLHTSNCLHFVLDYYKHYCNKDLYHDVPADYITTAYKKEILALRLERNGFTAATEKRPGNVVIVKSQDERFEFQLGLRYNDDYIALKSKAGVVVRKIEALKEWML